MGGCMRKYEPSDNDKTKFADVVKSQCQSFTNIQTKIIEYYLNLPDRLDNIIDNIISDTGALSKKDIYVYLYSLKKEGQNYVSDKERITDCKGYEISEIKSAISLKGNLRRKKVKQETQPMNVGNSGGYGSTYFDGMGPNNGTGHYNGMGPNNGAGHYNGGSSMPTSGGAIPYYKSPPTNIIPSAPPPMGGSYPPANGGYTPASGGGYSPSDKYWTQNRQ